MRNASPRTLAASSSRASPSSASARAVNPGSPAPGAPTRTRIWSARTRMSSWLVRSASSANASSSADAAAFASASNANARTSASPSSSSQASRAARRSSSGQRASAATRFAVAPRRSAGSASRVSCRIAPTDRVSPSASRPPAPRIAASALRHASDANSGSSSSSSSAAPSSAGSATVVPCSCAACANDWLSACEALASRLCFDRSAPSRTTGPISAGPEPATFGRLRLGTAASNRAASRGRCTIAVRKAALRTIGSLSSSALAASARAAGSIARTAKPRHSSASVRTSDVPRVSAMRTAVESSTTCRSTANARLRTAGCASRSASAIRPRAVTDAPCGISASTARTRTSSWRAPSPTRIAGSG